MKLKSLLVSLLLVVGFTLPSISQSKIVAVKTGNKIDVTIDNLFFTSYVFADNEKYPFFYPVNGPSGASVTSMRNGTYPHHSSLFFGCDKVNGGNYWQEGLERGRIVSIREDILENNGSRVVIENECIWSRPGAVSPVKDIRRIIISAPSKDIFQIDFEVSMEMLEDVVIEKTNHSLFSGRMDPALAVISGGTMINAEGAIGEKETFGKASAWIDFYGQRGDRTEGMAILQHPSNKWYPSPWFTRDYGFFSPTPMEWPTDGKSTILKMNEKIHLKYRVLVHSGTHETAKIGEQFEKYSKE
ncbi:MAG TPA: PmoA family protein [Prolixibacteraceae bacterium]|nr:PmoA family protein [Prolixibacteraceae bacterium]